MKTPDVVIIGGGVIGCSIAYQLAKEGVSVAIVDRGELGREASWASAGILTHGNPGSRNAYGQLATASRAMFALLADELREFTSVDPEYRSSGGLHVFFTEDEAGDARDYAEQSRRQGIACDLVDQQELRAREPSISQTALGALRFDGDGSIRNNRYTRALALAARKHGAELHANRPVVDFVREGSRIVGVSTPGGVITSGAFVIATGAWSNQIGDALDARIPVYPTRGQIVLLESPTQLIEHVIHAGDYYLVPRSDGRIIVGATVEEVGYDKSTTAEGIQSLLDWALTVAPGLRGANFAACWAGLRPAARGGPFLGRAPQVDNVFVATGHNRNGILLSAITGRVMKELIVDGSSLLPLDAFALEANREAGKDADWRAH